jgi:hypothetical protein
MVNVHIDPELRASIPKTSVATRDSIDSGPCTQPTSAAATALG